MPRPLGGVVYSGRSIFSRWFLRVLYGCLRRSNHFFYILILSVIYMNYKCLSSN